MTSLSCGVDALLRAAQFLEEQEGHPYRPIVVESSTISTEEIKPTTETSAPSPSLVVISHPAVNFTPQPATIDLSKGSSATVVPLALSNGSGSNSITVYSFDESPNLNVSAESSGYISNSTTSSLGNVSLNQSVTHGDDIGSDLEKSIQLVDQRLPASASTAFNALPMPTSSGRRRTISSNSGTLRSPSTVRAGTREVHNKLEKNRRAHLKECFEALKKQLPITADEKKTSNLSILGAAIRHIQFLKRKEREYEHEMERLAKEKISAQNRILFLRRELAQWDIDYSKLLPEQTDISAVKTERGEPPNDPSDKNSIKYSSSGSLSSVTSSACAVTSSTNLSPNIITSSSVPGSPPRITMMSTNSTLTPLPLTKSNVEDMQAKVSINPIKMAPVTSSPVSKSNIMSIVPSTIISNGSSIHSSMALNSSLNLRAADSPLAHLQTMPLNLQSAASSTATIQPQLQNGLKNGLKGYSSREKTSKSPMSNILSASSCITSSSSSPNKMDPNEPPTKLIKLINGSAILAPMQQVVGGGGLVVSPIQLLTSSQGFKVIGQSNGLTTIELSTPQINGQTTGGMQQRTHHLGSVNQTANVAQLHKLLINGGNGTTSTNTTNISIPSMTHQGSTINRLAPGGAELNLLPQTSTTSSNGSIYRNQTGKLAIVKETNNANRVLVQSAPHIVVSQGQSGSMTHFIASSPQLAGKMMSTGGTQYLSPMVVVNHNGKGNPATTNDNAKSHM